MKAVRMLIHVTHVMEKFGVSLDEFYNVRISPTWECVLQGKYNATLVRKLKYAFNLSMNSCGHVTGKYVTQFLIAARPLDDNDDLKADDVVNFDITIVLTD